MGEELDRRQAIEMSWRYVHILVEGETEETFVKELLAEHFSQYEIHLTPILLTTRRIKHSANFRGGVSTYGQVKRDLVGLLRNTSLVMVTTMIDFYGLEGKGFPDWDSKAGDCYHQVDQVEAALVQDINNSRFYPYLALHEFEALLFSDVSAFEKITTQSEIQDHFRRVLQKFDSPEEINLDEPPSKRIADALPAYRKTSDGITLARQVGLVTMREQCPHFNQWMTKIEQL